MKWMMGVLLISFLLTIYPVCAADEDKDVGQLGQYSVESVSGEGSTLGALKEYFFERPTLRKEVKATCALSAASLAFACTVNSDSKLCLGLAGVASLGSLYLLHNDLYLIKHGGSPLLLARAGEQVKDASIEKYLHTVLR